MSALRFINIEIVHNIRVFIEFEPWVSSQIGV